MYMFQCFNVIRGISYKNPQSYTIRIEKQENYFFFSYLLSVSFHFYTISTGPNSIYFYKIVCYGYMMYCFWNEKCLYKFFWCTYLYTYVHLFIYLEISFCVYLIKLNYDICFDRFGWILRVIIIFLK